MSLVHIVCKGQTMASYTSTARNTKCSVELAGTLIFYYLTS